MITGQCVSQEGGARLVQALSWSSFGLRGPVVCNFLAMFKHAGIHLCRVWSIQFDISRFFFNLIQSSVCIALFDTHTPLLKALEHVFHVAAVRLTNGALGKETFP